MKKTDHMTAVEAKLKQVNGLRRTRLLDHDDIVRTARRLRPGEHTFLHGGHVANAYKYPAYATGAVVFIPEGKRTPWCLIRSVSARRGSTGFGALRLWKPQDTVRGQWGHEGPIVVDAFGPRGIYTKITKLDFAKYDRDHDVLDAPEIERPTSKDGWLVLSDWWEDQQDLNKARACRQLAKG